MKLIGTICALALSLIILIGCASWNPAPPANGYLNSVNAYRTARGAPAVMYETELERMAQDHANELCYTGGFYHRDLYAVMGGPYGSWTALGEVMLKIGGGTIDFDTAMAMWNGSPSHRDAILDGTYTVIGVGRNICNGTDIWVMNLARGY